ncbi:sulfate/molybdate ABC transporter ATP-binding protein [Roseomonas sp. CCTCC AB2023176]|uniref:sulfate/molybdate ABC transporter ATP-binding protein n=1 Tax=Roseomonas sp. CCTCC AB2023176 TaxID=3342640 RepID=UPI0035DA229F
MTAAVEIRDVARNFGSAMALRGVSLDIAPGEFVALLGPSGSGKTTLLRILAGLEGMDSGTVRVGGRDMIGVPARERGVGVVFQHYALFRHMTVFENVAFGLRVRPRTSRPTRTEVTERVRELLRLVQIPELERRLPGQISGGQRQRVALARALAIDPQMLLLDEPFGALDALVRKDVRRWLRGLHDRLGLTTVLVTHDQEEAMELADRIAVMGAGRIVQCDEPAALLRDPATAFVAGFIGGATGLPCTVSGGVARFGAMPIAPVRLALPDGEATVFVRAPDVLATADAGPQGFATIRAVRHDVAGPPQVVADLGSLMLEATAAAAFAPVRGMACHLVLAGGFAFTPDGHRALVAAAAPAEVRRAPAYTD